MSKERARRRAAREHEAALRASARAAEAERRERRAARARTLQRAARTLPRLHPVGRPTGTLARRRRVQRSLLLALLVAANVLVWLVRPDWEARLAAVVVTVLAAPVLATLLLPRP
jgi:Flp pilus assembly protein TadB